MEPHEAHRGSQNAAAPGREIAGKDRCAVGCHQEAAAAGQVILHGTECSLYYRLVSKYPKGRANSCNSCPSKEPFPSISSIRFTSGLPFHWICRKQVAGGRPDRPPHRSG